jgi:hypothetical protein
MPRPSPPHCWPALLWNLDVGWEFLAVSMTPLGTAPTAHADAAKLKL